MRQAQGGAIMGIGLLVALFGALFFILGIIPAIQVPSQPADIPEVAAGALIMLIGFAIMFIAGKS